MKVIDLLNKIANGEEVPKKIKYNGNIYEYVSKWEQYFDIEIESPLLSRISNYNYSALNDEIEIIEEPKKIEKIDIKNEVEDFMTLATNKEIQNIVQLCRQIDFMEENQLKRFQNIENTINEIIDYINSKEDK